MNFLKLYQMLYPNDTHWQMLRLRLEILIYLFTFIYLFTYLFIYLFTFIYLLIIIFYEWFIAGTWP